LPGKTRPLLVALKSVDQAKHIISSARQLRQSDNSQVRDSVYINPNLTKAEAAAAYQLRTQRRLAAQRRTQQLTANRPQQDQHSTDTAAAPSAGQVQADDVNHTDVHATASPLNAAALSFVPASTQPSSA
jgi:hypothetical protein